MTKKDWQEAGDQIRDLVQNAIDSGNYSELSNTITDVVNSAVDGVQDVLKNSLSDLGRQQACGGWSKRSEDLAGAERKSDRYAQSHDTVRRRQEAAERIRKSMQGKEYHPVPRAKTPGLITGKAMKWTGYSLGGMFAVTAGILAIVSGATGVELALPMGIIDLFLVASVALGIKGSRQEGLAKRFRRYQQVIGERTFCLIEELSAAIGKKPKFVQKDLRKMIRDGIFPQGYLDKKETCLITTSRRIAVSAGQKRHTRRGHRKRRRMSKGRGTAGVCFRRCTAWARISGAACRGPELYPAYPYM